MSFKGEESAPILNQEGYFDHVNYDLDIKRECSGEKGPKFIEGLFECDF